MKFSPSRNSFFDPAYTSVFPADAVDVPATTYAGILAALMAGGSYSFDTTTQQPVAVPPPAPTAAQLLAQAQAAQIATLQAAYKAAINTPVSFKNAAGVTSTYPAGNTVALNGATAMQNLQRALDAGSNAWTLGKWLDTNNVDQTFTYADLQGLAAAMAAAQTLDWQDLVAKVAEVNAATTVSAVQAITF